MCAPLAGNAGVGSKVVRLQPVRRRPSLGMSVCVRGTSCTATPQDFAIQGCPKTAMTPSSCEPAAVRVICLWHELPRQQTFAAWFGTLPDLAAASHNGAACHSCKQYLELTRCCAAAYAVCATTDENEPLLCSAHLAFRVKGQTGSS